MNTKRAAWGEELLTHMTELTGVDREDAFSDAISYMLHAEIDRLHSERRTSAPTDSVARYLLNYGHDSFMGDEEDGPWAWEVKETA